MTGEKMEREDVDTLIKECCDEEDADGFVPYERKSIVLILDIMIQEIIFGYFDFKPKTTYFCNLFYLFLTSYQVLLCILKA